MWAVRTLELVPLCQLGQGIPGDDMATDQLHGRVVIRHLLPQDRAGKHRVVATVTAQLYLYGQLILGIPDCRDLSLLHHLLDVEEGRESHTHG